MEYEYDEAGNLTEVLFPDGGGAYYTYDDMGNLTSADSRHMYKLVYTYSLDNRGDVCHRASAGYFDLVRL